MEFLKNTSAYFYILRPKNLFLIALTMTILQYMVIINFTPGTPVLHQIHFPIFVLITLIIAGSGYLVNDIFDYEIDKINKPDKMYFSESFSLQSAWKYYYFLIITGLLLSVFIAVKTSHIFNLWIYPLVVWVLYGYAKKWKSSVLIGNIIVSLFVGFVWAILFYVEFTTADSSARPEISSGLLLEFFIVYFVFAFLINLMREVIKDIEDIEGDKMQNIKTLPLIVGVKNAVFFVMIIQSILLLLIAIWIWKSDATQLYEIRMFYVLFIICPLLYIFIKLLQARNKKDFSLISRLIKMVMFSALIGIVLIGKSF
ncbi:MAG: geranylgeranylglycerol-phosphate geranylgeranyltransferase [Saprospiraceae bacterium]|nr:geranylgeranylglycerol-phosphate geranylgeranyltransferase [Saprospiraceae bacterium]MBK8372925.1 geranylgeranylglycerol-phosphate geranylgeranyltransferase [Saprospiraceae bacterium]MBK9043510.1 geranylgeranylglycerol-phosphate geranylgeranyltransferase [Saprospiraceae bacterium]MBP6695513.1 geranylgeranylglycerol-phosphate geranylgeranyltransferase [Saprospiraceae bacterium]